MLLSNLDVLATAPGGVARLRELILTLAVQGKLVPQDPADEPASGLLKMIRAEKDRLIGEGKIRRDKPLAGISEEERPFGLPAGWEWVRFGDVALISSGVTLGRKTATPSPVFLPYLRVANVQRWHVNLTSMKEVVIDRTELDRFQLLNGDLLITEGGDWDKVGRTAIWRDELPTCVHQNHVFKARGTSAEWNPLWAQLFLNSPVARAYFAFSAKQTTNLASINMTELKHCAFPLPPLAEQARIVTRVEELMRLCDALEARGRLEATQHAQLVTTLLATLTDSATPEALAGHWQRLATHFDTLLDRPEAVDALEQTILQLAVRGLLVPQDPADEPASALLKHIRSEKDRLIAAGQIKRDKPLEPIAEDEQPSELPVRWEWARFGQIAEIASNLVSPGAHLSMLQVAPDCIEKGTGNLLSKRTVAEAGVGSPNHRFSPGQILYSKIRPSLSKAVLVDFEGLCSADMYPINSRIDVNFLLMYILSQPFLEQVSIAENRVKMPKLNQEALVSFMVPVPPLAEQSRIVARVESLRRLCADLRQRLAASQTAQAQLAGALVADLSA
jgi:type I restriction enzyme S subunit